MENREIGLQHNTLKLSITGPKTLKNTENEGLKLAGGSPTFVTPNTRLKNQNEDLKV